MVDKPEILEEDDSLVPSTDEEASALAEKLSALRVRCEAAGIEFQQEDEEGALYAEILIQAGTQ